MFRLMKWVNVGEVDQLGDCVICKELQNPTEENHNSRDLGVLDFIASGKNNSITNWQNNPIEICPPNIFLQRLSMFVREVY